MRVRDDAVPLTGGTPPTTHQAPTGRRKWLTPAAILLAFAALVTIFYFTGRLVHGGDSDVATLVLQGKSVSDGHVTLHGWRMVFDSFWTVEVPFYTLGVLLFGVNPVLLSLVPAVVAALVVLVGCWLAREGRRGAPAVVAVVTVVALLALPSGAWPTLFFRGGWHVGTVLWCLLAFAGLRRGRWGAGWAVAVVLLAAGLNGDLQTLPLGVGPVFGAGLVAMLRTRSWRRGLPTASAAVAGVALAVLVRLAAEAVGTYAIGPGNNHASDSQLVSNLGYLPRWSAEVFGAGSGPFTDLGVPAGLRGFHLIGLLAALAAVIAASISLVVGAATGRARKATDAHEGWRLDDLLVLGCYADVVFFVWATLSSDQGYLRYLMPLAVFGAVLTGRCAATVTPRLHGLPRRLAAAAGAAVVLVFAAGFGVGAAEQPTSQFTASNLSDFLVAHHLRLGVGTYWAASITTVVSDGRAVVRPVAAGPNGTIARYSKQSTASWYAGVPFRFLVYDLRNPWPGVDATSATREYGPPAHTYAVGAYRVLVWNRPFSVSPAT